MNVAEAISRQGRDTGPAHAVRPSTLLKGLRSIAAPAAAPGAAHPLPAPLRAQYETAMGADFSDVRVHVGLHAPVLGANAFATGSRLYFAPGAYSPETRAGRALIGHELGHVLQQRTGRTGRGSMPRVVSSPALEADADRIGSMTAGETVSPARPAEAQDDAWRAAPPVPGQAGPAIQGDRLSDMLAAFVLTTLGHQFFGRDGAQLGLLLGMLLYARNERRRARAYRVDGRGGPPNHGLEAAIDRLPPSRTLLDLPADQRWQMYIDPAHRAAASALPDPGFLYDTEQSPGYQRSMVAALSQHLAPRRLPFTGPGPVRTFAQYEALHDLVTAHLPREGNDFRHVRLRSGRDVHPPTNFPMEGHNIPAADVLDERIAGRRLLSVWNPALGYQGQEGICFVAHDEARGAEEPDARIQTHYLTDDGPGHVQAVLDRYHADIRRAGPNRLGRLRAIVRCIRALHVIHAFRDANGRLHVTLMLQKMLHEQGFSPIILQDPPGVFGGSYTIDELVGVVLRGMRAFHEASDG